MVSLMSLSQEIEIQALNDGYKQSEIARYVKVSDSTVTKIKGKFIFII
jgi:DNA-binding NarL/FixJ family response regulator